jgi:hypothetical protein
LAPPFVVAPAPDVAVPAALEFEVFAPSAFCSFIAFVRNVLLASFSAFSVSINAPNTTAISRSAQDQQSLRTSKKKIKHWKYLISERRFSRPVPLHLFQVQHCAPLYRRIRTGRGRSTNSFLFEFRKNRMVTSFGHNDAMLRGRRWHAIVNFGETQRVDRAIDWQLAMSEWFSWR